MPLVTACCASFQPTFSEGFVHDDETRNVNQAVDRGIDKMVPCRDLQAMQHVCAGALCLCRCNVILLHDVHSGMVIQCSMEEDNVGEKVEIDYCNFTDSRAVLE